MEENCNLKGEMIEPGKSKKGKKQMCTRETLQTERYRQVLMMKNLYTFQHYVYKVGMAISLSDKGDFRTKIFLIIRNIISLKKVRNHDDI